jgi:hypothetical protein
MVITVGDEDTQKGKNRMDGSIWEVLQQAWYLAEDLRALQITKGRSLVYVWESYGA